MLRAGDPKLDVSSRHHPLQFASFYQRVTSAGVAPSSLVGEFQANVATSMEPQIRARSLPYYQHPSSLVNPHDEIKTTALPIMAVSDEELDTRVKRRRTKTIEELTLQQKDLKERRRIAAKSSRDRKAAYIARLEEENERLQHELEHLKGELNAYRCSPLLSPKLPNTIPIPMNTPLAPAQPPPCTNKPLSVMQPWMPAPDATMQLPLATTPTQPHVKAPGVRPTWVSPPHENQFLGAFTQECFTGAGPMAAKVPGPVPVHRPPKPLRTGRRWRQKGNKDVSLMQLLADGWNSASNEPKGLGYNSYTGGGGGANTS